MAVFASFVATDRDFSLFAEKCFLELEREIFAKIGATLHPAALAPAATAKRIAKTKELSEDVAEVLKYGGINSSTGCPSAKSRVSEAVVCGSLVRIGKHRVGLAHFLEFFFRVRIARIAVGMKLERKLPICALDLLLGGFAGNSEHFVVVAFYVAGQNGSKSFRV